LTSLVSGKQGEEGLGVLDHLQGYTSQWPHFLPLGPTLSSSATGWWQSFQHMTFVRHFSKATTLINNRYQSRLPTVQRAISTSNCVIPTYATASFVDSSSSCSTLVYGLGFCRSF
jgi:hypothetical protein